MKPQIQRRTVQCGLKARLYCSQAEWRHFCGQSRMRRRSRRRKAGGLFPDMHDYSFSCRCFELDLRRKDILMDLKVDLKFDHIVSDTKGQIFNMKLLATLLETCSTVCLCLNFTYKQYVSILVVFSGHHNRVTCSSDMRHIHLD